MKGARATFGTYLRELRLKAGYGLRTFALRAGFQPSNLSTLERGKLPPPRDAERLEELAAALGLLKGSEESMAFFDLAAEAQNAPVPADVEGYARSHEAIPILLRTAQAKELSDDELRRLIDHINRSF